MSLIDNTNKINEILSIIPDIPNPKEKVWQEKSINPSTIDQTVQPDVDYTGLSSVFIEQLPLVQQSEPNISVSKSGVVTSSIIQQEGYLKGGVKEITKQLATKSAMFYTPTTTAQTIDDELYLTGEQIVEGAGTNLAAENIKEGTVLFGITGSLALKGTCTVTLVCRNFARNGDWTVYYTTSNNGIISVDSFTVADRASSAVTHTLTNVLVDSIIAIHSGYYKCYPHNDYESSGSYSYLNQPEDKNDLDCAAIFIPKGDCTINCYSSCCFVAGTQVMYSLDGSSKNIEDFKSGDQVVSYNINTGENYIAVVQELIVNNMSIDIADITFDNNTHLIMTAYHPIYCKEGFKSITGHNGYPILAVNDIAKTADGWSKIVSINRYTCNPIDTYTLAVKDINENIDDDANDNFYANSIVVHNAAVECTTTSTSPGF